MFLMQIKLCTDDRGSVQLPISDREARDVWAQYADALLLGEDMNIEIPGAAAGGHPVSVTLFEFSEIDPNDPGSMLVSVFRTCKDLHAESKPEPKLYVPKGALR